MIAVERSNSVTKYPLKMVDTRDDAILKPGYNNSDMIMMIHIGG